MKDILRNRSFQIGIFFALLTLIVTFPAIFYMSDRMIGDGGDGYQFAMFQYLGKKLFFEGKFPFGWTNFLRYPYGIDFQNITDSSLVVITGVMLYQFFSNPVVVYNITVLLFLFLNLSLTYISFRTLFPRLQSVIGAVIYGLSTYTLARMNGHLSLMFTSCFPLWISSLIEIYKHHGSKKSFMMFAIASILVAFSSLQYPLLVLGALPFAAGAWYGFFPHSFKKFFAILWGKRLYAIIAGMFMIIVFLFFHGNKLVAFGNNEVQLPVNEFSTVEPLNLILPNSYLRIASSVIITNDTKEWIEHGVFIGYIELVLFITALILLKNTRIKLFTISMFVVFLLLAMGTQPWLEPIWPYQYLFNILPYRGIIEPGRFFVFWYLALTFMILFLLRHVDRKVLIAVLVLVILERLPVNMQFSPTYYDKAFIEKAKEPPSQAILDLPVYTDWWNGQIYDMYAVHYQKPIVNGYFHWSGNTPLAKRLVTMMEPFVCYYNEKHEYKQLTFHEGQLLKEQVLEQLSNYEIRTVVIHKDLNYNEERCAIPKKNIETLVEDKDRWLLVFENEEKKILWLKY